MCFWPSWVSLFSGKMRRIQFPIFHPPLVSSTPISLMHVLVGALFRSCHCISHARSSKDKLDVSCSFRVLRNAMFSLSSELSVSCLPSCRPWCYPPCLAGIPCVVDESCTELVEALSHVRLCPVHVGRITVLIAAPFRIRCVAYMSSKIGFAVAHS